MMGVPPYRCAVVEDSVWGVLAGVAAGMDVYAYAGSSITPASKLQMDDVVVFDDMADLPALLSGADRRAAGTRSENRQGPTRPPPT